MAKRLAEEEDARKAGKQPSSVDIADGNCGPGDMQGVTADPMAEKLQQLARSSNADEAGAAQLMLLSLGIPKKDRSTPY